MTDRLAAPSRAGTAALLLVLLGCASSRGAETPGPEEAFREGLAALDSARADRARGSLEEVRDACGTSPLAQQAVLVEAAAALRGQPNERDPTRAAELAAAFLRQPRPPAWGVPVAESLYLMALELGAPAPGPDATAAVFASAGQAPDEIAEGCAARWDAAVRDGMEVPTLAGTSMAARMERLEGQIQRLRLEIERLRGLLEAPDFEDQAMAAELEELRSRLREFREEVERLRALLTMPEGDGG